MNKQDRIYVAGHTGLVGSAIVRALERGGYGNIVTRSHGDLDLAIAADVDAFFRDEAPDVVIDAAARVGGIVANDSRPAEFIRDNLLIQTHLIHGAWRAGAQKFVFLGSSCIYPKLAEQPIRESALLTGELEPTNRAYAIAKIAGIEMCQAYRRQYGFNAIALMPTNLYGPNDNFDLESSHVLPAIIRKCHEARLSGAGEVILWGTGTPRREFLFVDDLADAVLFLAERYDEPDIINVGTGSDISIAALAALVAEVVGFDGEFVFDDSKPDGTPRKVLDVSRLEQLGWRASRSLRDGIAESYDWYISTLADSHPVS